MFDTSPVFDAVRMNLLQNDRGPSGLEEFMVILMTQIESLDDITELTEVVSFIEKYRAWHEARPTEEDRPFPDFVRRVLAKLFENVTEFKLLSGSSRSFVSCCFGGHQRDRPFE